MLASHPITPQEAAIDALFQEQPPSSAKLVQLSPEQILMLKNAPKEERRQLLQKIYSEGRDARTIHS